MTINYAKLPQELRSLKQWINWRAEPSDNPEKPTKVPVHARTLWATDVTDPTNGATLDDAALASRQDNIAGIGFCLHRGNNLTCIDLDNVYSSSEHYARCVAIVEAFASYTEWSPSGKGWHVWLKGEAPSNVRRDGIEMYSYDRYLTMTGNVLDGYELPFRAAQFQIEELHKEMYRKQAEVTNYNPLEMPTQEDAEILITVFSAINGTKARDLYEGRWQAYYPSQSEADQSLVNILQYYSKSPMQIIRMFRASALGQRAKAQRSDYIKRTLDKAFDREIALVHVENNWNEIERQLQERLAATRPAPVSIQHYSPPAEAPDLSLHTDTPFAVPPGLIAELVEHILLWSPRPNQEIALCAALGILAGFVQKAYTISNEGLSLYLLLLARTGVGKDMVTTSADIVIAKLTEMGIPAAADFRGKSEIASGQGLLRMMADAVPTKGAQFCTIGEFGKRMSLMVGTYANSAQQQLSRMLLELYTRNGPNKIFSGSTYSDSAKNTAPIKFPALTLIGEGVPHSFYDGITDELIQDGLISRFTIIEAQNDRASFNPYSSSPHWDNGFLDRLMHLVTGCLMRMRDDKPYAIPMAQDAQEDAKGFDKWCDEQISTSQDENTRALWTRAYMKMLKLAALAAISENPTMPTVSRANVWWAGGLVEKEISRLIVKEEKGMLGDDHSRKQAAAIADYLLAYCHNPYDKLANKNNVDREDHKNRVIAYAYIQQKMANLSCFKRDDKRSTFAIRAMLEHFCKIGAIMEVRKPTQERTKGNGYAFAITDIASLRSMASK